MRKILKQLGFNTYDIDIYEYLIKNGPSKPRTLSDSLQIKRPTVYKSLYTLQEAHIIEKVTASDDEDSVFKAKDPRFIEFLIQKRNKQIDTMRKEYLTMFPLYSQLYQEKNVTPVVDMLYGVEGLKKIHSQIEAGTDEVLIIRSAYDRNSKKLYEEIDRHVAERSRKHIPTKIITPRLKTVEETLTEYAEIPNREMRLVDPGKLSLATQIMVFGDKVAITNYREEIVTLLVHQRDIRDSFATIFEFMWETLGTGIK